MSALRIGVDFGGTKIEVVALDADGAIVDRRRTPTPRGDYDGSVRAVAELVAASEAAVGAVAPHIGMGVPGALSPATGLIKNANSTWLIGRPFDRDLAAALGRPVAVENDANCFALSEAVDGAATGAAVVFGVIVGTGVGGGVVIDGRVLRGADAIAGEWGHNPLPNPTDAERPGPECYCGRRGCVEAWCSGPGLVADHIRNGADERFAETAETAEDVARAAAGGAPAATATLARHADRLGRALAGVVNVLDPEVIVLGGGLSNMAHLYEDLPRALAPHVFSDRVAAQVRQAVHGDSSGVRGAAWLPAPDRRREKTR